jgi:7,8-didemethyl-8-hydroxy-5-deazariboflavin synthase CofG subunit
MKAVGIARIILRDMNIQVPPNLSPTTFGRFLEAGINDWGGISPLTLDHVNPEYRWPSISSVRNATESRGHVLRARLPVYPSFLFDRAFISEQLRCYIEPLCDDSGLVPEDYLA